MFSPRPVDRIHRLVPGQRIPWKLGLGQDDIQSPVIIEVADLDMPCFWPEAKRQRQTNPRAALRQAAEACPPGRWPIAICKDDGEQAFVTMQLPDFLDLVSEWWEARQ